MLTPREAILDSVARACAVGETAVLLSGGLDSALLALLAARVSGGGPVTLCSARGGLATAREVALADEVAKRLGTSLLIIDQPEPWWPALIEANRGKRFPVGGAFVGVFGAICNELSSRGIYRVISGDGADDLFAADQLQVADLLRRRRPVEAWRVAASMGMWLGEAPARVFLENGLMPALLGKSARAKRHACARISETALSSSPFVRTAQLSEFSCDLGEAIATSWLPENRHYRDMVAESRWRATIDALEAVYDLCEVKRITPYLDDAVIESVLRNPSPASGRLVGARDKEELRRSFADVLPPSVRWHNKTGQPDVVGRAVDLDDHQIWDAFDNVRNLTNGLLEVDRRFARRQNVPPEMQQTWLRSLYLAAWVEANDG